MEELTGEVGAGGVEPAVLAARAIGFEGSHPATRAATSEVRRRRFMMRGGWMFADCRFRVRSPGRDGCLAKGQPSGEPTGTTLSGDGLADGVKLRVFRIGRKAPRDGANPGSPRTALDS